MALAADGPDANDVRAVMRGIVDHLTRGPNLAWTLTKLGMIDEYRIYLHSVVLGRGRPYFAGPRPRLRLTSMDRMSGDVVRLTYSPD